MVSVAGRAKALGVSAPRVSFPGREAPVTDLAELGNAIARIPDLEREVAALKLSIKDQDSVRKSLERRAREAEEQLVEERAKGRAICLTPRLERWLFEHNAAAAFSTTPDGRLKLRLVVGRGKTR